MTIMEIGAIGEFLGAIGVIATLAYLSVQIRQNTRSMEEGRRMSLAQTYQMRADALQEMVVTAASSDIGAIIVKLTERGYPERIDALDSLDEVERGRFRLWQIAQQTHWDNMHFQYQQGFLDEEYYREQFSERVVRLAPTWRALDLQSGRTSFFNEVARLEALRKAEYKSGNDG
ncbi:MAG: hypothetical protein P8Y69_14995 [Gammaproteobacteria bacterium]